MDKKVFIIEDDVNIMSSLRAKFGLEGYKTEGDIGNGSIEEILMNVKMFSPDFIILDMILPNVDGFEIARELKSREETKNIPIFAFTNLSDKDSKSRGISMGVDYYLIKKDLSYDEFIEKVKKILNNKEKVK
ncbi:MAG: response regulator [Candidatus Falkowbacteria bacterium]